MTRFMWGTAAAGLILVVLLTVAMLNAPETSQPAVSTWTASPT